MGRKNCSEVSHIKELFTKFHWKFKNLDECDPVRLLLKLPVVKLKKELRKTQNQ